MTEKTGLYVAVSTVVGVILLVAIAVLLAGAVGTLVFGFGDDLEQPPPGFSPRITYNDTFKGDGEWLRVVHKSGAVIETDSVRLSVEYAESVNESDPSDIDDVEYTGDVLETQAGSNFTASKRFVLNKTTFVEAGDGQPLNSDEYLDLSEAIVRVIWTTPDGERSEIIFEWRGPDADTNT